MKFAKFIFSFFLFSSHLSHSTESVVVVGGGVGGMTAALYLARAGLTPLLIEGSQPGGLITQSHAVQNWPGELEISGIDLADKLRSQAAANGVRFVSKKVQSIKTLDGSFQLTLDDQQIVTAKSVILAMGTTPNHLGIPGETGPKGYWGKGVTNCAVCDGALYRNQVVGVVGGGDAAVLEALYLSNLAQKVYVFVRKNEFKGVEKQRLQQLLSKPNVNIQFNTTVQEIQGDGSEITGVALKTEGKPPVFLKLKGLFLAIGSKPNTEFIQHLVELDSQGYVVLKKDQQTSLPGMYAIGDVVDPVYKQAISAAGDGAKAALQVEAYLASSFSSAKVLVPSKKETSSQTIEIVDVAHFEQELESSKGPVFVDFYASWCGPCKRIAPQVDRSSIRLMGKIKCLKVNVDTVEELASRYHIRSMPTGVLLDSSGHEVDRKVGSEAIISFLDSLQ